MKTTTRPGYTRCTYGPALVPLGRARTRCPTCGARLQSTRADGLHYRPAAPQPEDLDLPTPVGEPEPLL